MTDAQTQVSKILREHQFKTALPGIELGCYGCDWTTPWDQPLHECWDRHRVHLAAVLAEAGLLAIPRLPLAQAEKDVQNLLADKATLSALVTKVREERDAAREYGAHMRAQYEDRLIELDEFEAEIANLREQIAQEIQRAKPPHMTRDYTPVDAAYDDAARIARGET